MAMRMPWVAVAVVAVFMAIVSVGEARPGDRGVSRGDAAMAKKNWDTAIEEYSEAIRLDPRFGRAYCGRGTAYLKKRDFDAAIADYSEAIRMNPTFAAAYYSRGLAYVEKGKFDEAIADYKY
jgi:tetratricopeptide (TPR) repeat protein